MTGVDAPHAGSAPSTSEGRQISADRGRGARRACPRSDHGGWKAPDGRASPVAILTEQARDREAALVPIRNGRMLVSPFTFYRGAAAIMAADLATTPTTGIRVQACGDAHLLNFGGFASPERNLVFDVNDFDETLPGPWEWDVKRLAASIAVAGRAAGVGRSDRADAVSRTVGRYREAMRDFAAAGEMDIWYARLDEAEVVRSFRVDAGRRGAPNLKRNLSRARTKNSLKAFAKLTEVVDGRRRIVSDPPLVVPIRDLVDEVPGRDIEAELRDLFARYRATLAPDRRHLLEQFELIDLARKVVGVGSVGTRCWIGLLMGRSDAEPVFVQIKEAQQSVLAPFAGRSTVGNQGQRVVEGQRLMQATSDILLGWIRVTGLDGRERDFYVRQLWDWKVSADPADITAANLGIYGALCGWTLARAHARSGDRIAIAAYLGTSPRFDEALRSFAESYADQNERDYEAFAAAAASGAVPVESGI